MRVTHFAKKLANRNVGRKNDAPVCAEVAERLAKFISGGVQFHALHSLGSLQLARRHKRFCPRTNASNRHRRCEERVMKGCIARSETEQKG